jgi:hypothetical protein
MANIVNLEDLEILEINSISQSEDSNGISCMRIDLIGVNFDELLDRLIGVYGLDGLMSKIEENM